jgi:hypothetical protein
MIYRKRYTTSITGRLRLFIGSMLVAVFMVPTVAEPQSSPAPVNLRTAGNFVVLSKTGISTTGTTKITGDIGVSPIAAAAITGFGLIMDASNTFSTSSLITGKVYAANYTAPTPTKMTTAVNDMQTAYTDAAGRVRPNFTELYSGNLTGRTLTRGLYKWSTRVQVNTGAITLSGSATDVFIFQIAQNLTMTSGAKVTLTGGALASNVFWQVAGQVTIGTTVDMKGIILCKTLIAINTGATLNGRALAQTAVTLIANTIIATNPTLSTVLKSFISTVKGSSVILKWTTSSEVNNHGFDIERSVNQTVWTRLGFVAGSGTTNSLRNYTFTDNSITTSGTYYYRLKQINNDGTYQYFNKAGGDFVRVRGLRKIDSNQSGSDAEVESSSATEFLLNQNYPNPFNPSTVIAYSIPQSTNVMMVVYNSIGQNVKVLENGFKNAGNYTVSFNASELPSGVYFYRIEAGQYTQIRKMMLLK